MKIMTIRLNTLSDANSFVKAIDKYDYDVDAVCGRYVIDAKSIMGILSLGLPKEIDVLIHTNNREVIDKFQKDIWEWCDCSEEDK